MARVGLRPRMAKQTAGPDEETVAIGQKTFRRRRLGERWRKARPFVLSILAIALVCAGVWLVWFSNVMLVTGQKVTGLSYLKASRIVQVARVPHGVQLARVDLGAIEARVEAIPAVKKADVSRSWPHTVSIAVTERVPVAVVQRPASGLQAVDTDGVLFWSYARRPTRLPLIKTAPDVSTEALAEAANVIASLRDDVAAHVESLDVQSVDRIMLDLKDGRQVLWGSAEHSDQKAEVLAVLLDKTKAKYLDVSVPGRPVTR